MRDHVEDKLEGIVGKFFDRPFDANVYFSRQRSMFHVQCSVHIGAGITVQGHYDSDDPYTAFDFAAARLEKQLRRYKRRLTNHHRAQKSDRFDTTPAQSYVLAEEDYEEFNEPDVPKEPAIIAEIESQIETLTVGEAVMRMDLEDIPAFMFRNKSHGRLNMIYRRPDGNVGWLDPRTADTD